MKLRNLNGAIRKIEGPVLVKLTTGDGVLEIGLVKSTLIDSLKTLYGDDNTVETSLTIDGSHLRHENGTPFGDPVATAAAVDLDEDLVTSSLSDDEDLLGADTALDVADDEDIDLLG